MAWQLQWEHVHAGLRGTLFEGQTGSNSQTQTYYNPCPLGPADSLDSNLLSNRYTLQILSVNHKL